MIETKRMEKYQIISQHSYLLFIGEYSDLDELLFAPKEKDLNLVVQLINMKLARCIENYDREKKYNKTPNFSTIMSELSKYIYYALHIISFAKEKYKIDIRAFYDYFIRNIKTARIIINLNLDLN